MAFEYSSFISYRRENQRNEFIKNFCKHFATPAWEACDIKNLFVDTASIGVGTEFNEKIYNGIRKSYFFTMIHNPHYLNENNNWCAKELKYAIDVEDERRKLLNQDDQTNYKWIFPLIITGTASDLPIAIKNRNAKEIRCYMSALGSKNLPQKVHDFFEELRIEMSKLFDIYERYNDVDFSECCKKIPYPTDEEIKLWIKEQKNKIQKTEQANLPLLNK